MKIIRSLGVVVSPPPHLLVKGPPKPTITVAPLSQTPTPTTRRLTPSFSLAVWAELASLLARGGDLDVLLRLRARQEEHTRVRAFFLLLADLHRQGWRLEVHATELWLAPPHAKPEKGEQVEEVKARLRGGLLAVRAEQLADKTTQDFLKKVTKPRFYKGRRTSILELVDNGLDLASQLREAALLPPSMRDAALSKIIRPEIEFASTEELCSETGIPLNDVWRFFRHTWSLEYRPTPGRTLLLLIRNGARPHRPVMGIASLANAIPQLRGRDQWVGWIPSAALARLKEDPSRWPRLLAAMRRTLAEARENLRTDDLLADVQSFEGQALEAKLREIAGAEANNRARELKAREEQRAQGEVPKSLRHALRNEQGEVNWLAESDSSLFRLKRARTLADLLFSSRLLATAPNDSATFISQLERSEDLARAFSIALREIRKVGIASRLLDVNVCGAAQPYRELLGGKLVALCLASAEVAAEYHKRYGGHASEIASRMAGKAVVRATGLCLLSTTSLYGVSSSQYNRLNLKVPSGATIRWHDLGLTEGFGTVHLGEETMQALRRLWIETHGGLRVNNQFGEGTSPRLRQVRDSLELLGVDSEVVLRHSTPRRMYALELFPEAREALVLNEPSQHEPPSMREIADAWLARWLSPRSTNEAVLRRVSSQGPQTVQGELSPTRPRQLPSIGAAATPTPRSSAMDRTQRIDIIQGLYRSEASIADLHTQDLVDLLHIETSVDHFIKEKAADARHILLVTGNPGDGKTHLIRKLEPQLKAAKVEVCLDANEHSDQELVELIERAHQRRGGCVIAINEGTLVELLNFAGDRPWASSIKDQILHPFSYRKRAAKKENERSLVVDLNLRNNLAEDIITKALRKLVSFCAPCAGCPASCDLQRNAERLGEPSVIKRVVLLMDTIARTGFHATMRDLQGFLGYLLTGDRSCDSIKRSPQGANYWRNAFEGGAGPLFDAVRALDPQLQTTPLLDDLLWRQQEPRSDWSLTLTSEASAPEGLLERREHFISRKRRAFFEHKHGHEALAQYGTQTDRVLADLFKPGRSNPQKIIKHLNRFFDRDDKSGGELLYLWNSHRYDARPNRYAAARWHVAADLLEVLTPEIRPEVKGAFPSFNPDHVILCYLGKDPATGLRVDRPLIEALLSAERGLPSSFRDGEPTARISAFFDRLSKMVSEQRQNDTTARVRLVDMDTGSNKELSVDIDERRYIKE